MSQAPQQQQQQQYEQQAAVVTRLINRYWSGADGGASLARQFGVDQVTLHKCVEEVLSQWRGSAPDGTNRLEQSTFDNLIVERMLAATAQQEDDVPAEVGAQNRNNNNNNNINNNVAAGGGGGARNQNSNQQQQQQQVAPASNARNKTPVGGIPLARGSNGNNQPPPRPQQQDQNQILNQAGGGAAATQNHKSNDDNNNNNNENNSPADHQRDRVRIYIDFDQFGSHGGGGGGSAAWSAGKMNNLMTALMDRLVEKKYAPSVAHIKIIVFGVPLVYANNPQVVQLFRNLDADQRLCAGQKKEETDRQLERDVLHGGGGAGGAASAATTSGNDQNSNSNSNRKFCIVLMSSDQDFVHTARELRIRGHDVIIVHDARSRLHVANLARFANEAWHHSDLLGGGGGGGGGGFEQQNNNNNNQQNDICYDFQNGNCHRAHCRFSHVSSPADAGGATGGGRHQQNHEQHQQQNNHQQDNLPVDNRVQYQHQQNSNSNNNNNSNETNVIQQCGFAMLARNCQQGNWRQDRAGAYFTFATFDSQVNGGSTTLRDDFYLPARSIVEHPTQIEENGGIILDDDGNNLEPVPPPQEMYVVVRPDRRDPSRWACDRAWSVERPLRVIAATGGGGAQQQQQQRQFRIPLSELAPTRGLRDALLNHQLPQMCPSGGGMCNAGVRCTNLHLRLQQGGRGGTSMGQQAVATAELPVFDVAEYGGRGRGGASGGGRGRARGGNW